MSRTLSLIIALAVVRSVLAQDQPEIPPYSVQPYLRARFDEVGQALRFHGSTPAEAAAWKKTAREQLGTLLGLPTMKGCDLNPRTTEKVDCGDYTRERLEIQTEPGIVMPVFVLTPKSGKPPYAVMIAPHGHGGGGKVAVAGVWDDPKVASAAASFNYDYGVHMVRAGFMVFCPDARGFGERQERVAKNDVLRSSCQFLNNMAMPLGQTVTGMWVWDLERLIDYIQTRPDCDVNRLGCGGLSGGGLQTLWLAAMDDRVKAAVVSGYFYGVKDSLLDIYTNCSCNYVPHLWENADHGDLGALIAPRPLMVQSGDKDDLNGAGGLDNIRHQIETARRVYDVFGAAANLHHDVFSGPHRWDNTNTIPFLVTTLKP
jgi:dienelactone hydrolase